MRGAQVELRRPRNRFPEAPTRRATHITESEAEDEGDEAEAENTNEEELTKTHDPHEGDGAQSG